MANEEKVSDRLAPKNSSSDGSFTRVHPQDIEIRKFAIIQSVMVNNLSRVLEESHDDYGDQVIQIAGKIEDFIKNGKKDDSK